jgi:hypothetical protein
VHHGDPPTLRALFFSELWRGRDNLRVSLREKMTLRNAPSVLIPLLILLALLLSGVGALVAVSGGSAGWLVTGIAVAGALSVLRAARLWTRTPRAEKTITTAAQAWLVGATYDVARALALISRASHDVRRKG